MDKLVSILETPWGYTAAVWSGAGLWELSFPKSSAEEAVADAHAAGVPEDQEHPLAGQLTLELRSYFKGFPVNFGVPIDWRGYPPFRMAALRYTAAIPYGEIQTYGQIAQAIGQPKGARAVGGAMHHNRTPIVVPCHRVVGSNGSLTGFGGGLEMKQALLLLEKSL